MREVVFAGAVSLDNFIARENHSVDWLMWSDEAAAMMAEFWPTIDTVLMGRKTYEIAAAGGDANPDPRITTYVFSRTLPAGFSAGVTVVGDDAVGFVRGLRQTEGKDMLLMGGGDLACSFLEAGLVDRLRFNIHPVLLGRGIPLFHRMSRQVDLELQECQALANGCVYVTWRVNRGA